MPANRFELMTFASQKRCTTAELSRHNSYITINKYQFLIFFLLLRKFYFLISLSFFLFFLSCISPERVLLIGKLATKAVILSSVSKLTATSSKSISTYFATTSSISFLILSRRSVVRELISTLSCASTSCNLSLAVFALAVSLPKLVYKVSESHHFKKPLFALISGIYL